LGTDPKNPDTDGDGIADLWEIEHGDESLASRLSECPSFSPMDGLAQNLPGDPEVIVPSEIYGDFSEIYQVKSVHARQIGDKLYFTLTFYNNSSPKRVFPYDPLQAANQIASRLYASVSSYGLKMWGDQRAANAVEGIRIAALRDLELSVPLSYFEGETNLSINYSSWGKKGEHAAPI